MGLCKEAVSPRPLFLKVYKYEDDETCNVTDLLVCVMPKQHALCQYSDSALEAFQVQEHSRQSLAAGIGRLWYFGICFAAHLKRMDVGGGWVEEADTPGSVLWVTLCWHLESCIETHGVQEEARQRAGR